MTPITDKDFDDILDKLFGEESNYIYAEESSCYNLGIRMISHHFKTPQDVIRDYYQQKHLESVAPQKPTKFLMLARGCHKHSLQQLYLKEHWLELCFAELARKNFGFYNGSNGN